MNGKKNDGRMLDMEELVKVTGGEERRPDFNPGGQQEQQGNLGQQGSEGLPPSIL